MPWRRGVARRAVVIFLLASCLFAGAVRAAAPETLDRRYFHRNWRQRDGLPGNSVYAIAQSADSYLWVGTENGLARFDGQQFTTYGEGPGSVFRSRLVMALLAGADGTLWIGTERGLLRLRGGEVSRDGFSGEPAAEAAVSALAQGPDGDLWIGTRSGLLRRGAGSGRAVQVGLAGMRVTELLAGGAGEVWIGTEAHGAWRLRDGRLSQLGADPRSRQETVTGLLRDPGGAIWIFTRNRVSRFQEGRGAPGEPGRKELGKWGLGPSLGLKNVIAAGAGPAGFWLATADRGPVRVSGGRRWLAGADHPLANALVYAVFVADNGSVWFGSAGDGLYQLVESSSSTYTRHDGLTNDGAASVWLDPGGTVWTGTLNGLNRMTREAGGGFAVHGELRGEAVFSVLRDRHGTLWAGTSHGLARQAGRSWEFLPPWGATATQVVGALHEDCAGNLWVGAAGGLGVVAGGALRVVPFPALAGQEITGLAEAKDGALWIGTRGAGLLRLQDGRLVTLRSAQELPIVAGMRRGSAHDMWVGTFGNGLLHYRAGRWYRFHKGNGLSDDTVRQVLEDRWGDVWICSGAGISRLSRKAIGEVETGRAASLIPFTYGPEDGIGDGVCHAGSEPGAARGAGGELWFATNHGLVEVRPNLLTMPQAGRGPRLDSVAVDGRELGLEGASPLPIPGGARRIDLRFSFPAFLAQQRTAIRYRLVGFDPEWIVDGGERLARYTTLPVARYRFEVALRDAWGSWQDPVRLVELEVQPLFYQRFGFKTLVALALAGAVGSLLHWRGLRLRRRAAELTRLVEQRTEELREANRQLGILAVVDPLTGVANRRQLQETMEREVRRCVRNRSELSLIMVDIDHFKGYNDSLGHVCGDDCLRRVAAALDAGVLRAADLLARYGGEEFAVLLPETSPLDALHIAENLRHLVQGLALANPGAPDAKCVTISAGVAAFGPAFGYDLDISRLIQEADEALYRAKRNGRDQVHVSARLAGALPAPERRRLAWAGSGSA
jgi:diguanylate cyclase (GGDEF)-like protein